MTFDDYLRHVASYGNKGLTLGGEARRICLMAFRSGVGPATCADMIDAPQPQVGAVA